MEALSLILSGLVLCFVALVEPFCLFFGTGLRTLLVTVCLLGSLLTEFCVSEEAELLYGAGEPCSIFIIEEDPFSGDLGLSGSCGTVFELEVSVVKLEDIVLESENSFFLLVSTDDDLSLLCVDLNCSATGLFSLDEFAVLSVGFLLLLVVVLDGHWKAVGAC
jgi:hypothetical protein